MHFLGKKIYWYTTKNKAKLGFARFAELSANDGVVILCRIK